MTLLYVCLHSFRYFAHDSSRANFPTCRTKPNPMSKRDVLVSAVVTAPDQRPFEVGPGKLRDDESGAQT